MAKRGMGAQSITARTAQHTAIGLPIPLAYAPSDKSTTTWLPISNLKQDQVDSICTKGLMQRLGTLDGLAK